VASDPVLDHAPREGVRTFTPRWRNSPLTDRRMAALAVRRL
jgi:tRNA (guanine-N7-)-methyltransferase